MNLFDKIKEGFEKKKLSNTVNAIKTRNDTAEIRCLSEVLRLADTAIGYAKIRCASASMPFEGKAKTPSPKINTADSNSIPIGIVAEFINEVVENGNLDEIYSLEAFLIKTQTELIEISNKNSIASLTK